MDAILLKGLLVSNQQAYCCNNPVLHSDSNGRDFLEDAWNGLCSFGQLLLDAFNESQRIKMENAQAEHEAWQAAGEAIGNAASTAWDWYVDVVNETQRIQMANDQLQYEGMKAIGSWISKGLNALGTALLDGLKAQQEADIISAYQAYHAATTVASWISDNWMGITDWVTAVGGSLGNLYGIIQSSIPALKLAPVPIVGQLVFLAAGIWGIMRLCGFGE